LKTTKPPARAPSPGRRGKRSFIQVPWRNSRRCSVRPGGSVKRKHRNATRKTLAS